MSCCARTRSAVGRTLDVIQPSIRKATRHAFLLGQHISHSLSPAIFNTTFAALGLNYAYDLLDVPPDRLQDALTRMRQPDCLGGNVTMPYKHAVLAVADECSEAVRRCGAANLLANREGRFALENTDVEAIATCLARRAVTIMRGPAVVIGTGGAAAAMLEAMRRVPPTRILILARHPDRAKALVDRACKWLPVPIDAGDLRDGAPALARAALILNATSLGMQDGDSSPVPKRALRPAQLVYDIVYNRKQYTQLQSEALDAGALVCDGLTHQIEQAPPTFRLLTGCDGPREIMLKAQVAVTGRQPLAWGSDAAA